MPFEFLKITYHQTVPHLSQEQTDEIINQAVEYSRHSLKDWDRFQPAIEMLSTYIFCNHATIPLVAYLESLHSIAKHAGFTKVLREQLKRQTTTAAG
jgi:hypothetical protein